MKMYKIAVIPGDGAGPEVLTEGMKVLKRVAELDGSFQIEDIWFPWGCEYYLKTGRMMPEDGIEILETFMQSTWISLVMKTGGRRCWMQLKMF